MPLISYLPEEYKKGFKELAIMEQGIFDSVLDNLSKQELNTSILNLASKVSNNVKFDSNLLREVFYSVSFLIPSLEGEEDIEETVADIIYLARFHNLISEKDESKLSGRITQILLDKKLFYAYKATDLITENKNIFISSKIITDIRPIFDLNIEEPPKVGITQHTLHLHYNSDSGEPHKDFYITLTSDDIQTLLFSLLRAEDKEKTLVEVYKKAGITSLEF
ncbi:MAG: hypothetical protein QM737_10980 [Ferruginibacter sp.]